MFKQSRIKGGLSQPQPNFPSVVSSLLEIKALIEIIGGLNGNNNERYASVMEVMQDIDALYKHVGENVEDLEALIQQVNAALANYLPLTGGTLTGNLVVDGGPSARYVRVQADAGQPKGFVIGSGLSNRWVLQAEGAESGTANGANLALYRYNNSGGLLGQAMGINRENGLVNFPFQHIAIAGLPFGQPGLYTPSASAGINVTSITAYPVPWIRLGDKVICGFAWTVNSSATGAVAWSFTLPIASNFSDPRQLTGSGAWLLNQSQGISIRAISANTARAQSDKIGVGSHDCYGIIIYHVR